MTKSHAAIFLNVFLLLALILTSCSGAPVLSSTSTPPAPTPTIFQQPLPPALVQTDPPPGSVLGHHSPITFYFNQPVNKPTAESALSGLPEGTFTWNDDATLLYTPAESYSPDSTLRLSIANSLQSANGLSMVEPIDLAFPVADYLIPTNFLPKPDAEDVDVDAAIAVSFNQPVVALGGEAESQPSAFTIQPPVNGRGEWINTSTYIFYPEPALKGGMTYTVTLDPELRTASGVGFAQQDGLSWTFTTSRPRVVSIEPSVMELLPLDPEIKLTFNQPMNPESVESGFSFAGPAGKLAGEFSWNEEQTEMTFRPRDVLNRNVGYILNLGAAVTSRGGMILGMDYGSVFTTYDNFDVRETQTELWRTSFRFTTPLASANYNNLISIFPPVDNVQTEVSEDGLELYVYGDFAPDTNYTFELSGRIRDRWGQSLGDSYIAEARTPPLPSSLWVPMYGWSVAFVRPDEPVLYANAVSIASTSTTVAPLSLPEFFSLHDSYENQQSFVPQESVSLTQTFDLPPGKMTQIQVDLTQDGGPLLPGLYYVNLSSPQLPDASNIYLVAVSQVNLTFKHGATESLVWAVDLPSRRPMANARVTIYDQFGTELASGTTDERGVWRGAVAEQEGPLYAMLEEPGDESFALAVNNWTWGISAWDFGYSQQVQPPHTAIYMYTDRPIYRPGHTVYFRGVARQAFNGRYELPSVSTIPIILRDPNGIQLASYDMELSRYGTFHGEYALPVDAIPGYYTFENTSLGLYFTFQVAEYRKPEINLSVEFAQEEIRRGDPAEARVEAKYFFGAPAGGVEVQWALYARPERFSLPGYETGLLDTSWLVQYPGGFGFNSLGEHVADGTGQTTSDGQLSIELPAIPDAESGQVLTLEVTAQDESGLPVSARAEMRVHPADFYSGLRPDQWIGRADQPLGFDVFTVDWEGNPSGEKELSAEFMQVRWERETDSHGFSTYTPVYTPVSSSDLITAPDGKARLSFIPPAPGTYMLQVSGDGARSQILVWVGGAGTVEWPDLPDQKLQLTADRESYRAGETARIFIPNPFAGDSPALITVERGLISRVETITLRGSGHEYLLELSEADAPNVYVSVTVLGEGNDFRYGLVNIPVMPEAQALNVQVTSNPTQAGPRDEVTLDVQVTDHQGRPVEGEFSLSVVDLAVLRLSDPNAADILPAFYSEQPLGVETGLSVVAYTGRSVREPGGWGGGGGADVPILREDFPDTAYWNPSLITDADGRGQVTMTLPDSLTTWQVDVRGLTMDTRVGQSQMQIVASKPLLIRPVTPRFVVNGDHLPLAAIVHNNTSNTLTVNVALAVEGFVLDDEDTEWQTVEIPAHGQVRVEWWGTVMQDEEPVVNAVFSAVDQNDISLTDKTRPVWGTLPIVQYTSPQTFVTGGVLRDATSRQEVISLPRTFEPSSGSLEVELSPSLAGSLLSVLETMEPPATLLSPEATISYLLPNLEVYRALNSAGLSDPGLTERVQANAAVSISRLLNLQNEDGGWNWWGRSTFTNEGIQQNPSDPYISAYVFFGLVRAREIGMEVSDEALQHAGTYLSGLNPVVNADTPRPALDEITFVQFILSRVSPLDQALINQLYDQRDRLSPSSQALLAYILHDENPADPRVRELLSNLEASAILTASGAHWETPRENIQTTGSSIYTTSLVVYVLAQLDPANSIVFNAVRYLAAHRTVAGAWNSGHENAWALLALNEAMLGFGDLNADFAFHATLNGGPLATGEASGNQVLVPVKASLPIVFLSPDTPNLLTVQRERGLGRLYYRAALRVNRPVPEVEPVDAGMRIERVYTESDCDIDCPAVSSISLRNGRAITARLTLVLPEDAYYVMIEDFIPAGTEILNRSLKTSQLGIDPTQVEVELDERAPFATGWGWWLFHEPQIRDDSILFSADYLPAGTYVLTYTLIPLLAGEYQVLPAHAWESFFPEVYGTSAGAVLEIEP
jgi:uncharacterized protein YfaS (alpha-2-macroglobulin family)